MNSISFNSQRARRSGRVQAKTVIGRATSITLISTRPSACGPNGNAGDQENRDVGNADLLRDECRQRADRKNQPAGAQDVLRDGDGD
jgi:hypothetical protein